jgi:hypothetical protein
MSAMSPSPTRRGLLAAMAAAEAIEVTESEGSREAAFRSRSCRPMFVSGKSQPLGKWPFEPKERLK